MIKLKKKSLAGKGIEEIKSRYGLICVSPWIFGLVIFFAFPIIQSLIYTFCKVSLVAGGLDIQFTGLENLKYVLSVDPKFTNNLVSGIGTFSYSFPIILVLSLVLALLLNQKFPGRIFFRAIYFLPVIIASGVIMATILTGSGVTSTATTDESILSDMINVSQLIDFIGLPDQIGNYFEKAVSSIMNLIWDCGVQIILFIAGMQSIPELYYEVSRVEGATAWEAFWFITLPSLSRVIVLVTVFTMVELMTSNTDPVVVQAYGNISSQFYGEASAMMWIYFLIIGAIMGVLLGAFNYFLARKWE